MRTGFHKGYKYEIRESHILLREIERSTNTKTAEMLFEMIKEFASEHEIIDKGIIVHIIEFDSWYQISNPIKSIGRDPRTFVVNRCKSIRGIL